MTMRFPWCAVCESIAVYRPGDTCGSCKGTIDALLDPIERLPDRPPRPPSGVRFLRWLSGVRDYPGTY